MANLLAAQNFKYNTAQFGINGSLLGGAIVAGTDDMSMTFYNPAAIYKTKRGLDVSLIQPRANRFGFGQFWNEGDQSNIRTSFGLASLQVSFKIKVKQFDLAFIKINKSDWDDELGLKQELLADSTIQTRDFQYGFGGNDSWYGVGTSFELSPRLHIGISQFVSIGRYYYRNEALIETANTNAAADAPTTYYNSSINSEYNNVGFISKVGLAYTTTRHNLGLTVTTPLYGRWLRTGDFTQSTIDVAPGTTSIDEVVDPDISPTIQSPWELSLGYSFAFKDKRKIWLTANYHTEVADYAMVKIQSFGSELEWLNAHQAIFNYGIGYSDELSEKIDLLGGVRMNNFAYQNRVANQGQVRNLILDGNTIHVSLGTKLHFNGQTIVLGFDWGILQDGPNAETLQQEPGLNRLGTDARDFRKASINLFLTYGFVLDVFRN